MTVVERVENRTQRIQENPFLPTPVGIRFRAGSQSTMPDYLYGRGYCEFNITNETLTGIKERSQETKIIHPEISSFLCVGTPLKALFQAVLLEPTDYFSLIDISGQNTFSAVLLFSSLKAGFSSVSEYLKTDAGSRLYKSICAVFPTKLCNEQSIYQEQIDKSIQTIDSIDFQLKKYADELGIPIEKIIEFIKKVGSIEVQLDSIQSSAVLEKILRPGTHIIDSSNIPLRSALLDNSTQNPIIFFSFNALGNVTQRHGIRSFGRNKPSNSDITYWNYPSNDPETKKAHLLGGIIVGAAPYKSGYRDVKPDIDSIDRKW